MGRPGGGLSCRAGVHLSPVHTGLSAAPSEKTVILANTSHPPAIPELEFRKELDAAMRLARDAGAIIRAFYEVPPTVRWKDPTEPVTEADRAANVFLVKQLAQLFPEDGILAEESKDDLSRLRRRRVWIVDPLDGTAEFIGCKGFGNKSDGA